MADSRGREGPGAEVVRDPLWQNIRLEPAAVGIVDTPAFQRLRYIRQLGHAFLVYPGATHSRFEHALGTYHLACRALDNLRERGSLEGCGESDALLIRLAALLQARSAEVAGKKCLRARLNWRPEGNRSAASSPLSGAACAGKRAWLGFSGSRRA